MKNGLKILCIAILLYVVVSAFLHPISPGIISCDKTTLAPGYNELVVTGYRTHFVDHTTSMLVFLESDSNKYCGQILEVKDNAHVKIGVEIPDTLSSKSLDVYVNNDGDGTLYLPLAVSVNGAVKVSGMKDPASCKFVVKNNDSKYFGFPFQPLIFETIRNLVWHVPMWFTMFFLMGLSFTFSLLQLRRVNHTTLDFSSKRVFDFDLKAEVSARTGMVFCILGLLTGSIWARFTWGAWWVSDPQLNGALVVFLIYSSYFILRATVSDEEKRARLSAIYNIFAFVMMVVLLMVMPKFVTSLHPGKEGTPAFSSYDLDSSLRTVFYPAVIGWGMLGYWLYSTHLRIKKIEQEIDEHA